MLRLLFLIVIIGPLAFRLLMALYQPNHLKERETRRALAMLRNGFGRTRRHSMLTEVLQSLLPSAKVDSQVYLIDSPVMNAVALPDGTIVIWAGLWSKIKHSPDLIAAVLGHELGHIKYEHFLRSIYWVSVIEFVFGFFARPLGVIGRGLAKKIVSGGYSRYRERQADDYALKLMRSGGYNPQAMVSLFEMMANHPQLRGVGFLGSHPDPIDRAKRAQRNIDSMNGVFVSSNTERSKEQLKTERLQSRNVIQFPSNRIED